MCTYYWISLLLRDSGTNLDTGGQLKGDGVKNALVGNGSDKEG